MTKQTFLDLWLSGSGNNASGAGEARQQPPMAGNNGASPTRLRENTRRGSALAAVAAETRILLPDILKNLPDIHASRSEALYLSTLPALQPSECPRRAPTGKTAIRVINEDTFNAAIALASSKTPASGRVAVLNMASNISPGGGWRKGARAQEEALCYRSSLYLSLHKRHYPFKQRMGLYSPDVVVIRSDMASGHKLLIPDVDFADLPVFSVLSIAALRGPATRKTRITTTSNASAEGGEGGGSNGGDTVERLVYADPASRELTKDKMRLCLRIAARRNHGLLVLGALGCGAFHNPREEVALCWLEVLREAEFQGGWWEEVWFAVYDARNEGNFEVFEQILGGVEV